MKVAIYCRLSEEDRNKQFENDDSGSIQNQKTSIGRPVASGSTRSSAAFCSRPPCHISCSHCVILFCRAVAEQEYHYPRHLLRQNRLPSDFYGPMEIAHFSLRQNSKRRSWRIGRCACAHRGSTGNVPNE